MATHSSILVWEIPRTEEPGGLLSTGSQRVAHALATKQQQHSKSQYLQAKVSVWTYSWIQVLLSADLVRPPEAQNRSDIATGTSSRTGKSSYTEPHRVRDLSVLFLFLAHCMASGVTTWD